jgi:hypothetical protein
VADSRRSSDEIHVWLLNGDLRPLPDIGRLIDFAMMPALLLGETASYN